MQKLPKTTITLVCLFLLVISLTACNGIVPKFDINDFTIVSQSGEYTQEFILFGEYTLTARCNVKNNSNRDQNVKVRLIVKNKNDTVLASTERVVITLAGQTHLVEFSLKTGSHKPNNYQFQTMKP